MTLDLSGKTIEFLKQHPEQKFTAREIGEWMFKTYPEECKKKKDRSTAKAIPIDSDDALKQQIIREISSRRPHIQKKHKKIKSTEGRPRKYYFTELSDSDEITNAESNTTASTSKITASGFTEHDLYPMLSSYLMSEFKIFSKRIEEKGSRNSRGAGGNKWLHPDLVGMEDLSSDWCKEIQTCVKEYASKKTRLWSFEVKKLINRSNVRESFFQAVSNSSWANFGYLSAGNIQGEDTIEELLILASLHGIGVILLNTEDPLESQILIPARERNDIDWNTANRLAEENKDFIKYIEHIRVFYQSGKIDKSDWNINDDQN